MRLVSDPGTDDCTARIPVYKAIAAAKYIGGSRRRTCTKLDIIVATPEDLEKYKDASLLVHSSALKDGKVIYPVT